MDQHYKFDFFFLQKGGKCIKVLRTNFHSQVDTLWERGEDIVEELIERDIIYMKDDLMMHNDDVI